jgi:hypothetical protein
MSNGRPFRRVHRLLHDLMEQTEDQPIAGGCDTCDAYQTVSSELEGGVYSLIVHHDAWCPRWRARNAGTN